MPDKLCLSGIIMKKFLIGIVSSDNY